MNLSPLARTVLRISSGLSLLLVGSLFLFGGSESGNPLYFLLGLICYVCGVVILMRVLSKHID